MRTVLNQLGFNVDHSKLVGLIRQAFTLNSRTLTWLALIAAGYALVEVLEAAGLWLLKRWGEYFAMVATSVGIPYEIYDLTAKITVLRLAFFSVNVALVVYLVLTKRLFGARGGKKAYDARLRGEHAEALATLLRLGPRTRLDAAKLSGWIASVEASVRQAGRPWTAPGLALADLDLDATAKGPAIRVRYIELVKRCHPDANGGDRSAEHKLQRVIRAYKTLRKAKLV